MSGRQFAQSNATVFYEVVIGGGLKSKHRVVKLRGRVTEKRVTASTREWDRQTGRRVSSLKFGGNSAYLLGYQIDALPFTRLRDHTPGAVLPEGYPLPQPKETV